MPADEAREHDPTAALELLWDTATPRRRGPKPGLDIARIVASAIELADADGLAALSMRGVATRLGVAVGSLYTYVPGKTELIALMLDTVAGNSTPPHTFPGGWRDKLEAWAREDWHEFRRHPWVPQVASARPLPGPNMVAWYESALTVLAETSLPENEKVAVIEAVDGYVRGSARTAADASEAERRFGAGSSWTAQHEQVLSRHIRPDTHPRTIAAAAANALPSYDSVEPSFEFGLQRLLGGIETFIESRTVS